MPEQPIVLDPVWVPTDVEPDAHVALRAVFDLEAAGAVELRTIASGHFLLWLDGRPIGEGPIRYAPDHPESESIVVANLPAGRHVLAAHVHHDGVETRLLKVIKPFFVCDVLVGGQPRPLTWRGRLLSGYARQLRRVNPELGWAEWVDTRKDVQEGAWTTPGFDDASWDEAVSMPWDLGVATKCDLAPIQSQDIPMIAIAEGTLSERFGYESDDPQARFYLRDLSPTDVPPQGVWRRYDLGRVRLGRARVTVDAPVGAVVQLAYSETLERGRVAPWITLSGGTSCHVDHYVTAASTQVVGPIVPRGGRYVEVHVLPPAGASASTLRIGDARFLERGYYAEPEGAFDCDDELLPRLWHTGVETLRACAEDALVDNPTRERGQWAGDVVGVGLAVAAVAYSDLRPLRRGLVQSGQCAREDGLVAGLCPGQTLFLSTYAAQWLSAGVEYARLTGDVAVLHELYPAAQRNVAAFEAHMTDDGLRDEVGWSFIDWGYVRNAGPCDMGMNLHYLLGLRDMVQWAETIGCDSDASRYAALAMRIEGIVKRWMSDTMRGAADWSVIGYHRVVLALRAGVIDASDEAECVAYVKRHMLDCFPNNLAAPRLSDPGANNPKLITPYFAHYAMPELAARGEIDFVLAQLRHCWGWMLDTGATTWLEVFDTRWSHCHQWAGCPTWLLARYLLGLKPQFDLGQGHFSLDLHPSTLTRASGKVPWAGVAGAPMLAVSWERVDATCLRYHVACEREIHLHVGATTHRGREIHLDVPLPGVRHIPGDGRSIEQPAG